MYLAMASLEGGLRRDFVGENTKKACVAKHRLEEMVARTGIGPVTQGFSVLCSTS